MINFKLMMIKNDYYVILDIKTFVSDIDSSQMISVISFNARFFEVFWHCNKYLFTPFLVVYVVFMLIL